MLVLVLHQQYRHSHVVDAVLRAIIRLCHSSPERRAAMCEARARVNVIYRYDPHEVAFIAAAQGGAPPPPEAPVTPGPTTPRGGAGGFVGKADVSLCDALLRALLPGGYAVFPSGAELACRCMWHVLFDATHSRAQGSSSGSPGSAGGARWRGGDPPHDRYGRDDKAGDNHNHPHTPAPSNTHPLPDTHDPQALVLSHRLAACRADFAAAFAQCPSLLAAMRRVDVVRRFNHDGTLPEFLRWKDEEG